MADGRHGDRKLIVVLGISFFTLFAAYIPSQALLFTFFPSYGSSAAAVIYACFALSTVVAPSLVRRFGTGPCMIVSACGYVLFVAAGTVPSFVTIMIGAAIVGFSAAPLWTAQGVTLTECSVEGSRGKNSSLFLVLFRGSTVVGNLLSGLMLNLDATSVTVATVFSCVGSGGVLLLIVLALMRRGRANAAIAPVLVEVRPASSASGDQAMAAGSGSGGGSNNSFEGVTPGAQQGGAATDSQVAAAAPALARQVSSRPPMSAWERATEMIRTVGHPHLRYVLPYCFFMIGLMQNWFLGVYTLIVGKKRLGFVIAAYGACIILTSIFFGRLFDRLRNKKIVPCITLGFCLLGLGAGYGAQLSAPDDESVTPASSSHIAWIFAAALLTGTAFGGSEASIFALIGRLFPGNSEVAFASRNFVESCGAVLMFALSPRVPHEAVLLFLGGAACVVFVVFASWRVPATAAEVAAALAAMGGAPGRHPLAARWLTGDAKQSDSTPGTVARNMVINVDGLESRDEHELQARAAQADRELMERAQRDAEELKAAAAAAVAAEAASAAASASASPADAVAAGAVDAAASSSPSTSPSTKSRAVPKRSSSGRNLTVQPSRHAEVMAAGLAFRAA